MSAQLVNVIAKRVLKDSAKKNINSKDPYFEEVPVYDRQGRPTGKLKKQKKGLPAGLSQNDTHVLKRVRKRAYRLDMSLCNCCGIRFGWSSIIGFVPFLGDGIDLFMAWLVVKNCAQIDGGLPSSIQYRMYFNIILDFALGLVPFIGDVADAVFRANTRNAWILEEYLTKKAEEERKILEEKQRAGANAQQRPALGPGPASGSIPSYGPGTGRGAGAGGGGGGASASASNQPAKQPSFWSRRDGTQDAYHHDQEMGVIDHDAERNERRGPEK
ncbi:PH domain containing protein [Niveomyces insectorum RCEF 264]|uniref:PH domain containing protein n=1 Tax=Niveomyces insectorum RCEF 264 TaxID=1081102 RepID=A0A167QX32_9HYPO|nr:PH domain containing protein [Niveomyces insectorum RCEF 264]